MPVTSVVSDVLGMMAVEGLGLLSRVGVLGASSPDQHVYGHPFLKSADGTWIWSANMGNLVLSMVILVVVGWWVSGKIQTGPESLGTSRYLTKNKFAHMIEVVCVYLREEVARPLLGKRTNKLMPFLWTIFFFIWVNNLLGLVPFLDLVHLLNKDWKTQGIAPIGGTATQNIWVTGVLAIVAMIFFNLVSIKHLGVKGYLSHLTAGAPFPASVLIFFLELASQFVIKPFALAMRLFANMTAGHILLATLFAFAGMVVNQGLFVRAPVTLIAIVGGFGVMLLEIFVATMQAFVFMFLTTVFIALMDHHDHEHDHAEHGHEHGHGHAHAH